MNGLRVQAIQTVNVSIFSARVEFVNRKSTILKVIFGYENMRFCVIDF